MNGIKALSDEELLKLVDQSEQPTPSLSALSDEELLSMSELPTEPTDLKKQAQQAMMEDFATRMHAMEAMGKGGQKGLLDFLSGAGRLGAKAADHFLGTTLQEKIPTYEPTEETKELLSQYPGAAALGEFAGGALPLAALPEAAVGKITSLEPLLAQLPKALQGTGRLAGRLAKGAGVSAALAPVYEPEKDVLSVGKQGALLGGLGAALGPVAGLVMRGMKQAARMGGTASSAEVKDAIDAAKRLGVKIPLGEATESPILKKTQSSFLSDLPFSGMSQEYIKIGKGLNDQIESILSDIQPSIEKNVGSSLQDAIISATKKAESEKRNLYKDVHTLAEKTGHKVSTDSYRKTASDLMKEITRFNEENVEFKDVFDPSIYSILDKARGSKTKSFEGAFDLDKRINNELKKSDSQGDYATSSILRQLKDSINTDIDSSAAKSGDSNLINAWNKAKSHFKNEVVPLRKNDISKFTKSDADLDTIIPTFLKTGQFERPQLLNRLTKNLSEEEKGNVAHQYLTKSLREGQELNSDSVLTAYNKLGDKQKNLLFGKEDKKKLDDVLKIRKLMGMDLKQMMQPKTGEKMSKLVALTSPATAYLAGGPAGALGLLSGGRLGKEALMSDWLKNIYLKSLSESKTPELGRLSQLGLPIAKTIENK